MKQRTAARLAWSLWGLFVIGAVAGMMLVVVNGHSVGEQSFFGFVFLASATVGALIASRQPQNPIGWIFLFIVTGVLLGFIGGEYGTYALRGDPGSPPGGVWGAWVGAWVWIVAIGPMATLLPLLFPDGRPLSPRWRMVAWLSCGVLVLIAVLNARLPAISREPPWPTRSGSRAREGCSRTSSASSSSPACSPSGWPRRSR